MPRTPSPLLLCWLIVAGCHRFQTGPLDSKPPDAAALPALDADPPSPPDAGCDSGLQPSEGGRRALPDEDAGEAQAGAGGAGASSLGGAGASDQGGAGGVGGEPPVGGSGGAGGQSGAAGAGGQGGATGSDDVQPQMRVLREHLNFPWEIAWGPDGYLWLTERTSFQVDRIDPFTGERFVALELGDGYQVAGQDGLLGMALDPGLLKGIGSDYVYVSYTYNAGTTAFPDRRQKIVRFTFKQVSGQLEDPYPLILGLPASTDHNSGRLVYGPDGKLYYSIGDQGANQYDHACQRNRAQTLPTSPFDIANYPGKVLRINPDGSVPVDNPVLAGVRSHVFTYGHRNAQGLSFAPDGRLYESEQGPKSDDEINLLSAGQNYGWPWVSGYQDDRAYAYREWASSTVPCATLTYSDYDAPASVPTLAETSVSPVGLTPPLATLFTVDSDFVFMDPACAAASFLCWPTIAPSSLTAYEGPLWPGTSLLVTSLKRGLIYRLSVRGATVNAVVPMTATTTSNRYRDIAVSPDGRTIYVVTDVTGASYVSRGVAFDVANPGAVLEFRF